jgi:hypothetical protein
MISKEHAAKSKVCKSLRITTGASSYLMTTALKGVCVDKDAVLWAHRPYMTNTFGYAAVPVGSYSHNYLFTRVSPAIVKVFIRKGGMKKDGWRNSMFLTPIKASETGLPICKD